MRFRDPIPLTVGFAREAAKVRVTESGRHIVGLICPALKWIYWDYTHDEIVCERCGATHTTPTSVSPIELTQKYLIPFSMEHRDCKEQS